MATEPSFTIALRGYERTQVDAAIQLLRTSPPGTVPIPDFTIVLRGYERNEVDRYLSTLAPTPTPDSSLTAPEFTIVLRGYERTQVDSFVTKALARIADLERSLAAAHAEPR